MYTASHMEPDYKRINHGARIEIQGLEVTKAQQAMGHALRLVRELRWQETQFQAALRIGVSRTTLQAMEAGDPSIGIRYWMLAWQAMQVLPFVTEAAKAQHIIDDAAASLDMAGPRSN